MKKFLIVMNVVLLGAVAFLSYERFMPCGGKVVEGKEWAAKKFGSDYVLSVKTGGDPVAAITDFVRSEKISAGNISGIGAVSSATLRFFDPKTKRYVDKIFDDQMEVANLTGNIASQDGKELIHLHVTLGNDNYNALAGHLLSARLNGAGEFVVYTFPGAKIEKTFNKNVGLNFYDFKK